MLGLALVADLALEAGLAVDGVGDLLQAAVGEPDEVVALSVGAVSSLLVAEVVAGWLVLHLVLERVLGWFLRERKRQRWK